MTPEPTWAGPEVARPKRAVPIWDLPTRLFHWALVIALGLCWLSGEQGNFTVHFISGHVVFGLVLFRLIWGVVGSQTARFSEFVRGPAAIGRYLTHFFRRRPDASVGHNPLGAVMVLALLGLVLVQSVAGLFASENTWAFVEGPLAPLVGSDLSETLTSLHKGVLFDALLVLASVHVLASILYLVVKRENLIRPMVTGRKALPADVADRPPRMAGLLRALVVAAPVAALTVWLYSLT